MENILPLLTEQSPLFLALIWLGWVFYKFLERTYNDHTKTVDGLQVTFKDSLDKIVNHLWNRLDTIEDTLDDFNSKQ